MPINTPTGYLDITNATLRGSKIVTTGFVGIANANPTNHLSIGSNLHINDTHSNVLQISGNINAASVVLGGISIAPTFDLEIVTNTGNTTPYTVEFNNTATAFVTTANATIGDTLTASKLVGDGSGISAIQSSNVTDFGSNVSRITALETDLGDNSARITNLSSNLSDNSARITNLSSNLSDNSARITNLSSNLSDNSSRITALESGDISISGDKTFTGDIVFESNVHMNSGNVFVANTVNLTVSDPIIELGSNNSGTNDLGIIMTRPNNNSNVAVVFDESVDILRMGYTLNGANDTVVDLDSNALAVSVQGALTAGSNLEVGTANLFVDTTTSNVGVGVSSPAYKLDVGGDINIASGSNLRIGGSIPVFSRWTASGSDIYRPSDNVGIGVAPSHKLDVAGDINFTGSLLQNGSAFQGSKWSTSGSDIYRSSGNVGIGTTDPKTLTHIGKISSSSTTNETIPSSNMGVSASFPGSTNLWLSKHSNAQAEDYWGMALGTLYTSGNSYIQTLDKSNSSYYNLLLQPNGGNVGIGTASPIAALDINGGAENNTTPALSIRGGSYDPSDLYVLNTYNTNTGVGYAAKVIGVNIKNKVETDNTVQIRNNVGGITSAGAIYLGADDVNQGIFGVLGGTGTAGSTLAEYLTVKANGNVGIGTASPGSLLTIESTTGNQMRLNYNADWYNIIERDSAGDLNFLEKAGASASLVNHMTIKTGGNVGIGTASPNCKLHVSGGDIGFAYGQGLKVATSGGSMSAWTSGTHNLLFTTWSNNTGAGDVVKFYTPGSQSSTVRMILTSAGNVGINTETMIDSRNYGGLHLANSKGISFAASTNSGSRHWRIRTDDYSDHGSLQFSVSDDNSSCPDANDEMVMTMDRNRYVGLGAGAVHPRANLQIGDYIPNNTGTNNTIPSSNMGQSASFPASTKIWMANRVSSTEEDYWGCAMGVIWDGPTYIQSINKKSYSVYSLLLQPNGGHVGIGYTSHQSYKLSINGSLYYTSGGLNGSDDRIKYNEQNVSNALALISQLKPQKYEKIMEFPNNTGTWIPTDEEWENVKADYKYGDEFGFIAQDVREIPELSFLVNGEETRMDTETVSQEEYSNLATEEQITFTQSYTYESNTITQEEYSDLAPVDREMYTPQYTKQTETETPLALNYQGLFVVAIGAIQELAVKNDALEAQLQAEKEKVADILVRVKALENA